MLQEQHERGDMWVLKKEVHRGKGVHVIPLQRAIQDAKKREEGYDLVQKYMSNQFTVLGRKFYVRSAQLLVLSLNNRLPFVSGLAKE